jgi:predicted nucleotidyltransferase
MNKQLDEIKQKIIPILKKHNVTRAGIFGSFARGEQKKRSDVDILVKVKKEMDLIDFIRLKNTIEKSIRRKIDLVEYECIRPELEKRILKEEIPIIR